MLGRGNSSWGGGGDLEVEEETTVGQGQVVKQSSLNLSLWIAAAAAKSLQSCQTLCDPIDNSPPGSPV